jgi:hypothetical protein
MSIRARFHAEVTDLGGEACLPRNLSDEWLFIVASSIDELIGEEGQEPGTFADTKAERGAVGLAAVLTILRAKNKAGASLEVAPEDLWRCIAEYQVELGLEEVHRKTDIKCEPASLATIFTGRQVRSWRERRPRSSS